MQDHTDVNGDTELLTAYLDNELEPHERAELEKRLVDDEALRLELRSLRRAWDLLDALPEVTVSRDFTTTTMKMIAKVISDEPVESRSSWSFVSLMDRFSSGMLHAAVAVPIFLAIVAGGAIAGYIHHKSNEKEHLNSVAAAAVLPTLLHFPDMKIAIDLQDFPMLDLLAQTELSRSTISVPPPANVEELHAWLGRLDPKDKDLLRIREEDFKRLPEQDKSKYVSTWKSCASRSDCASLQKTATLFAALLQSMEAGKRAIWKELPHDEKVARLREAAYFKIAMWYAENLSDADRKAVNNWMENVVLPQLSNNPEEAWGWFIWTDSLNDLWFKNPNQRANSRAEVVEELMGTLSDKGRKMIKGLSDNDRGIVLIKWIKYAEGYGPVLSPRSPEELSDAYLALPDDQREIIDLKDPGSVEWRLSRDFNRRKVKELERKRSSNQKPRSR